MIFGLIVTIQHLSFYYVEYYVTIPEQWEKNARFVCPNLRQGHLFHYNSFAGLGNMIIYPVFFFCKAWSAGTQWSWKFGHQEGERGVDFVSFIVKVILFLIVEFICRDLLPNLIWGTKDVDKYADFILKTSTHVTISFYFFNATWVQH